jgi:putative transposase
MFASTIRKRRVQAMRQHTHWRWHLDEVYVRVQGEMRYLWRAVDHEGEVLESFVTKERDKAAALKFMKKLMKRHGPATTGPVLTENPPFPAAFLSGLVWKTPLM